MDSVRIAKLGDKFVVYDTVMCRILDGGIDGHGYDTYLDAVNSYCSKNKDYKDYLEYSNLVKVAYFWLSSRSDIVWDIKVFDDDAVFQDFNTRMMTVFKKYEADLPMEYNLFCDIVRDNHLLGV